MCELKDVIQETVKPIMFAGFECCVKIETYLHDKDRIAILLDDPDTGEQIACATINVPAENLKPDEVIIKNYSENEGMLSTLILAKIISVPIRFTREGAFPVCRLLLKTNQP